MKTPQEALEKAKVYIRNADHMLTMTYPMVRDPKLLVAVAENLFNGLTSTVTALLYHERANGLPPFHESINQRVQNSNFSGTGASLGRPSLLFLERSLKNRYNQLY